ncbi:MAG: NAD-dependent epimerase/dehydratase family protein, partial [Spirochaetales bacterium]|nr:NAD-dependent epimerase/dehydratase family protein [Spirochaetales bacterium]
MRVLVTGTAGFIGYHTTRALAERGDEVMGLDSINDYYDVSLKYARLAELGLQAGSGQKAAGPKHQEIPYGRTIQSSRYPNLRFLRAELEDRPALDRAFADFCPEAVCNLAAQAGVRYSLEEPMQYVHSNVEGFLNILECCRHGGVKNLSYASTSSVYGLNTAQPFDPSAGADHPVSLYAATKRANEL